MIAQTRDIPLREKQIFDEMLAETRTAACRSFAWLFVLQWIAAVVMAAVLTPYAWVGPVSHVHQHVWLAIIAGGVLSAGPIIMALRMPAAALTRHVIGIAQVLYSALLIHLAGGRLEFHFHVFGSLAFLMFFRDPWVLVSATLVVAADHFIRGVYMPLSVFGSATASQWRWLEHAGWVIFEDIVLLGACRQNLRELRQTSHVRAELEQGRARVEEEVATRTAELETTARALRVSEAETRVAMQLAEAGNRAKSEFLANMSHEIRTPMTAILGYAELIMDPAQRPEERVESVQIIRRNGEHLLSLLNDILDLSKIEAGKMNIEHIACSPVQICEEVYSLMHVRAAGKQLRLRLDYDPAIPFVLSDPLRLRQVMMNLVGNAIKFTEQGEVVISARLDPVPEASLPDASRTLRFAVRDSGIGMNPDQLARLFKPFSQADNSTTRRFGGSGLGLLISRRLANMLGGEISVESAPGVGSTFTVAIAVSLAGAADRVEGPRHDESAPVSAPTALCGRILLAEDGLDNQRLVTHHLRKAGAEVVIAADGREAVAAAAESLREGRPFALILMDMQMPNLDGYGATSLIRQKGWTGPIVALTAHAMSGDRERCLQAGCDDYLSKPVDRAKLIATCASWISAGRAPTSAAA